MAWTVSRRSFMAWRIFSRRSGVWPGHNISFKGQPGKVQTNC